MRYIRTSGLCLVAAVLCSLFAGCASTLEIVTVNMDRAWQYQTDFLPSIEVHVIGVSDKDFHLWNTYAMSKYWQPGDRLREGSDKYVMRFGEGLPSKQVLKNDAKIWRTWHKAEATHLVILADLPGTYSDQPGNDDPRRSLVPITDSGKELEINIRPFQ